MNTTFCFSDEERELLEKTRVRFAARSWKSAVVMACQEALK